MLIIVGIFVIVKMYTYFYRSSDHRDGVKEIKDYTVFVTDYFCDEDSEFLRPIFTIVFEENHQRSEVILCKVIKGLGDGELSLDEGEKLMTENIQYFFKHDYYISYVDHKNNCIDYKEKEVIDRLMKTLEEKSLEKR